jgi:TrpR-related protein YerC/YecD
MPRFEHRRLNQKEKNKIFNQLFSAVGSLKNKQEIVDFFRDLLSPSEVLMLARRLQIAQMLQEGKSYYEIKHELSASFDTINSVKQFLDSGNRGYHKVIARLGGK